MIDGKVLVTGAAGFTGGVLALKLKKMGYDVRGTARYGSKTDFLREAGVELVFGDIGNAEDVKRMVAGCDYIFHIAALYRQANVRDEEYYRVNVDGTRLLLDTACESRVKKFVHCSTMGVCGHLAHTPADEGAPYNPGDIYQITKMEGEKLALNCFRGGRMNGVVVRPAAIYGPGDMRFCKLFKMINRRCFFVIGKGQHFFHTVYIDNLVEGFILAMEKDVPSGEVFIIADNEYMSLNDFFEMIADELGAKRPTIHIPAWPVQILGSVVEKICIPFGITPPIYRRRVDFFTKNRAYDISKAKEMLDYTPKVSVMEGIARTSEWYHEKGLL